MTTAVAAAPDLAPETWNRLHEEAAACGLTVTEYIEALIEATRLPRTTEELRALVTVAPGETNGMAEIFGKWPGDETDEEILAALEDLS